MVKIPNLKDVILGLFPILKWSREYTLEKAIGDIIAGVTIALTLIPQSMAYALLAGFEPQYGLYASFMGGFVYAFMGTAPQVSIGPAALIALLTFNYTNGTNIDFGVFLCFVTGIVVVVAGVLQLGFLVEFVSIPVVSGFTSAAALTISSSQLKGLLGLKFKSGSFIGAWKCLFQQIGETSIPDALLSVACCSTLIGMRLLRKIKVKQPADPAGERKAKIKAKTLWFLSVARNAVVVSLATILAACVHRKVDDPFHVTGNITAGLPTPHPPPFSSTVEEKNFSTVDMLKYIGSGILVVPLVAILLNVAIVKAFARGKKMEATQEIIALGVCNIVCSFFKSIPVSGSLSRGAVSEASGVRTPGAGFYSGTLVMLTLLLLTPYFYYIPRAALASVIVCAVLCMVDISTVRKLWKSSRLDLLPLVGCFFCCLAFGTEIGLLCGVLIDIMMVLYYNSRPPLDANFIDDGVLPPHYAIHPVGHLHYAGAEKVRARLLSLKENYHAGNAGSGKPATSAIKDGDAPKPNPPLVIYCDAVHRMDYTFLQTMKLLVDDWCSTGRVLWCNARPFVKTQLRNTLEKPIFCERAQLQTCFSSSIDELVAKSRAPEPGTSH